MRLPFPQNWGQGVGGWGRLGIRERVLIFGLALSICLTLGSCTQNSTAKLTIATAANMQFAMSELTQAFSEATAIPVETIVASSGKLTAQIQAGAPFDVFVSADMKYPTTLFEQGLTTQAPKIYAYGKLVLWSLGSEPSDVDAAQTQDDLWAMLTDETIRHIAIANPKTAPYGAAAIAALKHANLHDTLQPKLVFGESIAQVNAFVTAQAAEIGFTSQAVVLSPKVQGQGQWQTVQPDYYDPIAQGIVIIKPAEGKQNSRQAQAQSFYEFLGSSQGQTILKRFGFDIPTFETQAQDTRKAIGSSND